MIIDSKTAETSINCANIQKLEEEPKSKLLVIAYQLPEGKKMVNKEEKFECIESRLLLKTYSGISRQIAEQVFLPDKKPIKVVKQESAQSAKSPAIEVGNDDLKPSTSLN